MCLVNFTHGPVEPFPYTEAEGLFKRALAIKEQAFGANPFGVRFGKLHARGKYIEAEDLLKLALTIKETRP